MYSTLITAESIPRNLLKSAFLVGKIPFKAAIVDQRVSYCMYIPDKHYKSEKDSPKLPLIVVVHGTSRRAETCRDSLIDIADRYGVAILAPLFPAGINDANDIHNYKALRYHDIRYDLNLLGILDEVKQRWSGIATEKFILVGFSGGGQFCLRFLYLHPERIKAISIGAPGSVTHLDESLPWPRGIADVEQLFDGLTVNMDKIRDVKDIHLVVGDLDDQTPGDGISQWLDEKSDGHDKTLKPSHRTTNRKEALMTFRKELEDNKIRSQFDIVTGIGHDMLGALPAVLKFLEGCLR